MEPNADTRKSTAASVALIHLPALFEQGPDKAFDAIQELNLRLKEVGFPRGVSILSAAAGAIIVAPDRVLSGERTALHHYFKDLFLSCRGLPLRIGVSHGTVEFFEDVKGGTYIGEPINVAARVAVASQNGGVLYEKSYSDMRRASGDSDPFRPKASDAIQVKGKLHDADFVCYEAQEQFSTPADYSNLSQGRRPIKELAAFIVAVDLPWFSRGTNALLSKRFRAFVDAANKLLGETEISDLHYLPGGDGGIFVFPTVGPDWRARNILEMLHSELAQETKHQIREASVSSRIGAHYGVVQLYRNTQEHEVPTGLSCLVAEQIAKDVAHGSVVVTEQLRRDSGGCFEPIAGVSLCPVNVPYMDPIARSLWKVEEPAAAFTPAFAAVPRDRDAGPFNPSLRESEEHLVHPALAEQATTKHPVSRGQAIEGPPPSPLFSTSEVPPGRPIALASSRDRRNFGRELLCSVLPTVGHSEYEMSEKLVLFGGRPEDLTVGFTTLDQVVAGHAFHREIVDEARNAILASCVPVSSFSISSPPGGGLSIALSQLVHDFSADARTKVLWVIDDPQRTQLVLSKLSSDFADTLYEQLSIDNPDIGLVVIVLDDVSKTPSALVRNLLLFRERCKQLAVQERSPRMAFVFGSFGAARTLSEDATFRLRLTAADQRRCYEEMTNGHPKILFGVDGGLEAILKEHPETRWYQDDAQAFIDFLMEHGRPTSQASTHWLARTEGLASNELEIFTKTAAAQLIGLHVEERVARGIFDSLLPIPFFDVEQLARQIKGLAVVQDEWRGLGLSCARRARSILERTNCFTTEFVESTLSEFLRLAIDLVRVERHVPALEFARHIFQRLGKAPHYRFLDKSLIAQRLLVHHVDALAEAIDKWDGAHKGRWAGTLAAAAAGTSRNPLTMSKVTDLICQLCEDALKDVEPATSPKVLLSLYRAVRLLRESFHESVPQKVSDLCSGLKTVPDHLFWEALGHDLRRDHQTATYRANELIHARAQFEDCVQETPRFSFCTRMAGWYATAERVLKENKVEFDAANWLKRSQYVWVPSVKSPKTRRIALSTRAEYLRNAQRCLRDFPDSQGTWSAKVAHAVRRFVDKNPALGDRIVIDESSA